MYNIQHIFNSHMQPYISIQHFNEGELICKQGEAIQHLYVLVKGKVKVYTMSEEGKTLILSFKTPLELLGDIEFVRDTDTVNTVEAVSSVTLLCVPYPYVRKYGSEDPLFLQFLLKIITEKFYVKSNSLRFNLLYPVEVRLASYLLSVSFDESHALVKGHHSANSLRDTANLIGTSYRHVNRILQHFCEQGLVERQPGGIVVRDREGLQKMSNNNIYE
nr:cyclic nucleotide-binding domain-containing protein [Fictibacillus macauensis]